jgi:hypothetical protein
VDSVQPHPAPSQEPGWTRVGPFHVRHESAPPLRQTLVGLLALQAVLAVLLLRRRRGHHDA